MASKSNSAAIRQLADHLVTLENKIDAQATVIMFLKYFLDVTGAIDDRQFEEHVNRVLESTDDFGLSPQAAAFFREELDMLMPLSSEVRPHLSIIQGGKTA